MSDGKESRILGLIGGLGPFATAHYYRELVRGGAPRCDHEAVDFLNQRLPTHGRRDVYARADHPVTVV